MAGSSCPWSHSLWQAQGKESWFSNSPHKTSSMSLTEQSTEGLFPESTSSDNHLVSDTLKSQTLYSLSNSHIISDLLKWLLCCVCIHNLRLALASRGKTAYLISKAMATPLGTASLCESVADLWGPLSSLKNKMCAVSLLYAVSRETLIPCSELKNLFPSCQRSILRRNLM